MSFILIPQYLQTPDEPNHFGTFLVAQMVKCLGQEDPLEKEMAMHSSTLTWKIPWTEEPGRLQSMGSQRVRHNWVTSLSLSFLGICRNLFSGLPQITKPMDDQISYVKWHHTVNPLHLMAAPRRTDCITLALMWCFICIVSRWTRIPVFFLD